MSKFFFRQLISVGSTNVIAQILVALSGLIVGIIIGPEVFGEYSIVFGVAILISMLSTLKMELVIFDVTVIERLDTSIKVILISFFISLIITTVLIPFISLDRLSPEYLLAIALGGSIGMQGAVVNYFISCEKYSMLNKIRIMHAIYLSVGQIFIALMFKSIPLIILVHISANFALVLFFIINTNGKNKLLNFPIRILISMAKSNSRYVKYSMPAEFIGSLAGLTPLLIIQNYFGSLEAGLYAMALRIAGIPSGFIGKSVGEVFRGGLSNAPNKIIQKDLFNKSFYILFVLSLSIGIILFLINIFNVEHLFLPVEWSGLIQVLLIIWVIYGAKLIASPLSYSLFFFKKNHIDLIWQFFMLAILAIPFLFILDFNLALWIHSAVGGISYFLLIVYCRSLFKT